MCLSIFHTEKWYNADYCSFSGTIKNFSVSNCVSIMQRDKLVHLSYKIKIFVLVIDHNLRWNANNIILRSRFVVKDIIFVKLTLWLDRLRRTSKTTTTRSTCITFDEVIYLTCMYSIFFRTIFLIILQFIQAQTRPKNALLRT